jgi:hypothetical protein
MQASSCFGVIVVEPVDGQYPFTFDDERIVAVSDFWHASDDVIESGLLAPQVPSFCINYSNTVCVSR